MAGTNFEGRRPRYEGEVVRFDSPFADVELYDIAEPDKYGNLVWVAFRPPLIINADFAKLEARVLAAQTNGGYRVDMDKADDTYRTLTGRFYGQTPDIEELPRK